MADRLPTHEEYAATLMQVPLALVEEEARYTREWLTGEHSTRSAAYMQDRLAVIEQVLQERSE